jgi:hypothetical protein
MKQFDIKTSPVGLHCGVRVAGGYQLAKAIQQVSFPTGSGPTSLTVSEDYAVRMLSVGSELYSTVWNPLL